MARSDLRKLNGLKLTLNESLAIERELKVLQGQFKECLATYELTKRRTDEAGANEVQAFIDVGKKICAINERMEHGKWLDWVATNLKRSVDTARRWMRGARWAEANAEHVPHVVSVAMLMRLCGEDRRERVSSDQQFTLALALRLIAPLRKLDIDKVRALPLDEQARLHSELQPIESILKALPPAAPPMASQ